MLLPIASLIACSTLASTSVPSANTTKLISRILTVIDTLPYTSPVKEIGTGCAYLERASRATFRHARRLRRRTKSEDPMGKYAVEFIGTFFLVLTIGMTVIAPGAAICAPGDRPALMVMIYAGGHISGAHYNPAVTLAVFLRGKCALKDVPGYMVAQVVGGAVAAMVVSRSRVRT